MLPRDAATYGYRRTYDASRHTLPRHESRRCGNFAIPIQPTKPLRKHYKRHKISQQPANRDASGGAFRSRTHRRQLVCRHRYGHTGSATRLQTAPERLQSKRMDSSRDFGGYEDSRRLSNLCRKATPHTDVEVGRRTSPKRKRRVRLQHRPYRQNRLDCRRRNHHRRNNQRVRRPRCSTRR